MKLPSNECRWTLFMINQHCSGNHGNGWTNHEQVLWQHMASLGHNGLSSSWPVHLMWKCLKVKHCKNHRKPLMISHYWFTYWFGVIRQQAIHYLSQCWPRSITPYGHNDLTELHKQPFLSSLSILLYCGPFYSSRAMTAIQVEYNKQGTANTACTLTVNIEYSGV